jgi:hypothetical protein
MKHVICSSSNAILAKRNTTIVAQKSANPSMLYPSMLKKKCVVASTIAMPFLKKDVPRN